MKTKLIILNLDKNWSFKYFYNFCKF